MVMRWIIPALIFSFISSAVLASNNPFEKKVVVNIGTDHVWEINDGVAVKTGEDKKGQYYQLRFDRKQLSLTVTDDEAGQHPRSFSQFAVMDVQVDGKRLPLFTWCLKNQERHDRFLQQGLAVKKGICAVNGEQGEAVIRLNRATFESLKTGKRLVFLIKPYRTPLKLNYDLSDFNGMVTALTVKPAMSASQPAAAKAAPVEKKCWAGAPARYPDIKPVEYDCADAAAKKDAEKWVITLINKEKARERELALKRKKQQSAAQEKKRRELEAQRRKLAEQKALEEKRQAEAAAIAASELKQSELNTEITLKMVGVCKKFWDKGEHRCYCQKYIDYAPASIKENSSCQ